MRKRIINISLAIFLIAAFSGCSKQAKDRWLRTFFDGVPPQSAAKTEPSHEGEPSIEGENKEKTDAAKRAESAQPQSPAIFYHQPFSEKQCDACHDSKSSQKLVATGKELCFGCHEDLTKDKKIVHYPVSEGSCIECHDPHQSANKYILKKSVPEICFACHDEKEIKAKPAHDGETKCTECHNPHASGEEKLLKDE